MLFLSVLVCPEIVVIDRFVEIGKIGDLIVTLVAVHGFGKIGNPLL